MTPGPACSGYQSITRPAVLANLHVFQDHLGTCAAHHGLAPECADALALALEEVFVNLCRYAYPDGAGAVTLACRGDGESFIVEISDQGRPFDAAGLPEPELSRDIDARPVGGLGWFLVRRLIDELDCRRQDGRNIVRLTMHGRRRKRE
jgi:serine/threonine-protein kinase RsbW